MHRWMHMHTYVCINRCDHAIGNTHKSPAVLVLPYKTLYCSSPPSLRLIIAPVYMSTNAKAGLLGIS
ncbi:unnamed protein product [Periconia digitata]|uniref:Uncharacterized protein n=1 Tax=Periconia digitata TaxID=1303443 RepID=A0A9W4XI09_9PLEO|nr:unnamed protein product [Periconia digitata]